MCADIHKTVTHPRGWKGDGWNTVNLCRLCFNPVINLRLAIVAIIAQLCHAKDHGGNAASAVLSIQIKQTHVRLNFQKRKIQTNCL